MGRYPNAVPCQQGERDAEDRGVDAVLADAIRLGADVLGSRCKTEGAHHAQHGAAGEPPNAAGKAARGRGNDSDEQRGFEGLPKDDQRGSKHVRPPVTRR